MLFWNRFRNKSSAKKRTSSEPPATVSGKAPLHPNLKVNLERIKQEVGNSPDIIIREFEIGNPLVQVAAVYTVGISDTNKVNDFMIRSLLLDNAEDTFGKTMFDFIKDNALAIGEVKVYKDWNGLLLSVLSGDTVILVDGFAEALSGSTRGGEIRPVTEPSSQVVIRGPKDGFTETIAVNVSLVRRRIKNPNLWLEPLTIGSVTHTDVAMMYIKGIANDKLVDEVRQRLKDITTDAILESGYIEQLIQDQTLTPFPTLYNTERPDSVAANLLEGRVAIFVDGTPFVLIAPATFFMYFQASEDYYQRFDIASAIRLLRYLAFFISLFGPSVYIAAITFHQEMIPTPLLISLAAQREGVPFPALIEALIMEVTFEILREAGVRMPRAIGQAVSIVGALVLGQAAVQAGIISSAMVIVVSITGIASFSTPAFNMALSIRLLRFVVMICAAVMGFYGIAISNIIIIAHMCSLRSFGFPFMSPLAPFMMQDHKDTLIRMPFRSLLTRPRLIGQNKPKRMEPGQQSFPPEKSEE